MRRAGQAILAAAILSLLSACAPTITVHGFVPSEDEVAAIQPGVDTAATLEERIGRPTSAGLLGQTDWYYVQTTMEQLTYNPPRATDRKVVAIAFDQQGVVRDVQSYGLEDGQVVNLSSRVTPTGGQRRNALIALFGGLLNFNAESLLGDR